MNQELYTSEFFQGQSVGSFLSADIIVPDVIALTGADSVVDVGCGLGTWLAAYKKHGIDNLMGLDGTWVSHQDLMIPIDQFRCCDLTSPPHISRHFDLAQSLEVAEHLPPENAERFIRFLTSLSDVVLFSAAIPHQGGTNHVNEQWPTYWNDLFRQCGFKIYDPFRQKYWNDSRVKWWYRQNLFLYVKEGSENKLPKGIRKYAGFVCPDRVIHPDWLQSKANELTLRIILRNLPGAFSRAVLQRVAALIGR